MKKGLLPVFLLGLFVFGCASPGDVTQVRQDVSTVYDEQTSYKEKTDARISKIEKDIKDLQKMVGTPEAGLRKQVVDMSLSDQSRDDKVKAILGRLDELEAQLRTYWEETKTEMKDLRKQMTAPPEATGGTPPKADAEGVYKQAFDAFQKGSYDSAVTLFAQFVKENPDSPLAPNAYYWMGESYMSGKNYEKAIVQFQEVVDKFPKSDKAGKAMLRQAEAFSALGDKKSSTTLLKRVIELFPKSEEARLAERKLRSGGL
ncbi:MAG TPA: tol-pal system protein YbgF [Syntrophorhabdales bacterium]|nr:tol-pal system protein YbgF [Syntrophorhabdales bacterium]